MVDLSKFISNKKILNGVVALAYNQVCCQKKSLLPNFIQKFNYVGLKKKFRVVTKVFLRIKNS